MPLPRWRFCMVPRTSRIASWRTPRGLLTVAARDVKPGYEPVFYDEHGLDQQRAYQIICFMVGSDPRGFRTIATQAKLPEERQKSCRGDYEQAQASWLQLLEPHLRSAPPKPSFLDRLLKRSAPVSGPARNAH